MEKRRYLKKLFISYIILILIPIIIFGYVSYFNVALSALENDSQYSLKTLDHSINSFEMILQELDKTVLNLLYDQSIMSVRNTNSLNSEYSKSIVINKLMSVRLTNANVESIYFSCQNKYVFSSDLGFTRLDDFYDNKYLTGVNDGFENSWHIRTIQKYSWEEKCIRNIDVISRRYNMGLMHGKQFIVINLNMDLLSSVLKNFSSDASSIYILTPSESHVVSQIESNINIDRIQEVWSELRKDTANIGKGSQVMNIGKHEYNISFVESPAYKWVFMESTPTDFLYARANHIKRLTILAVAICIFIGFAASLIASLKAYKPVKLILNSFSSAFDMEISDGDEFSYIRNAFNSLISTNHNINQKLNNNYRLIKETLLYEIITSNSRNPYRQNTELINTILPGPFFVCCTLTIDCSQPWNPDLTSEIAKIHSTSTTYFKAPEFVYKDDSLVFILQAPDNIFNKDILRFYLEELLLRFNSLFGGHCTIGAGNVVQGVSSIHTSYINSLKALSYQLAVGANKVIFHDDFNSLYFDKKLTLLAKPLDEGVLFKHLNDRNAKGIVQYFTQSLEPFLKADSFNKDFIYIKYQQFLTCLLKFIFDNNLKLDIDINIMELMEVRTSKEMSIFIEELSNHIISHLSGNDASDLMDTLAEYIRKNYADDITLESLASKVYMSTSHLCRLFKQHFGVNPGRFIINTRMDMAERLLVSTDLQIQQIAIKVGYRNLNSFTKAFRGCKGVSPFEYRKQLSSSNLLELNDKGI